MERKKSGTFDRTGQGKDKGEEFIHPLLFQVKKEKEWRKARSAFFLFQFRFPGQDFFHDGVAVFFRDFHGIAAVVTGHGG